jgi:hypothetical protein
MFGGRISKLDGKIRTVKKLIAKPPLNLVPYSILRLLAEYPEMLRLGQSKAKLRDIRKRLNRYHLLS